MAPARVVEEVAMAGAMDHLQAQGRGIFEMLQGLDKELVLLEAAGHVIIGNDEELGRALASGEV